MGYYIDKEEDIANAWHYCPSGPSYKTTIGDKGYYVENTDTHEKVFYPVHDLNSFDEYLELSKEMDDNQVSSEFRLWHDDIKDYSIKEVEEFEKVLDDMGVNHIDGVSYLKEFYKKKYAYCFTDKVYYLKYNSDLFGFIRYIKDIGAKFYRGSSALSDILIKNDKLDDIGEALQFIEKYHMEVPDGKPIKINLTGLHSEVLDIKGTIITYLYTRYEPSEYLTFLGFSDYRYAQKYKKQIDIKSKLKRYVDGKLYRLNQYYKLMDEILYDIVQFNELNESDPLRKIQDTINNKVYPNLAWIRDTDYDEIIKIYKPVDDLFEMWGIERIPLIPLIKSTKRKISQGIIKC